MSDEILFKNVTLGFDDKPIKECELALECNNGNYRLYVNKNAKGGFFECLALEFNSCTSADNIWSCDDLMVSELFNLTAHFDGVRHLEFNRDNDDICGYIYYPNMEGIIELMQKVRQIEKDICYDCD